MLKFTGNIEVFKNRRGYYTAILKSFDRETKKVTGKLFIDVQCKDLNIVNETFTLNVTEGYINVVTVEPTKESVGFSKLSLSVVEYSIHDTFKPTPKAEEKPTKKAKSKKAGK